MTRDPSPLPLLGDRASGTRSLWLLLSLVAHAGVALVAMHRPLIIATAYALTPRPIELTAPDVDLEALPAPISASPAQQAPRSSEPRQAAPASAPSSRRVVATAAPQGAVTPTAPAAPSVNAPASPPRFVLAVGHASTAAGSVTSTSGASAAAVRSGTTEPSASGAEVPFAAAAVDTPAHLLRGDAPAYTREAEAAGVEAELPLEIIIDRNGAVTSARALRPAGYGLDAAALRAIAEYRFVPARRNGVPVAVRMQWRMRFQLR